MADKFPAITNIANNNHTIEKTPDRPELYDDNCGTP